MERQSLTKNSGALMEPADDRERNNASVGALVPPGLGEKEPAVILPRNGSDAK